MTHKWVTRLLVALAVLAAGAVGIFAVTNAIVTLFPAGDVEIVGTAGLVSDDSCGDLVAVIFTDATGSITDIDYDCLDLGTGVNAGYSYHDPGSYEGAASSNFVNPITVSVFDIGAGSQCYLDENSVACGESLLSGGVCIEEVYGTVDEYGEGKRFGPSFQAYSQCNFGPACRLNIPADSVVGEAPAGAQVYYSPGNIAPNIVLNPGTYIVVGQDVSETYYKVVLACQFVWVRKDTMQPSFQAPQNGTPLPTRIVS